MGSTADFRTGYVRRVIDDELDALLPEISALLIDGPKAVGKTATALQRAATVRRLDRRAERVLAAADPVQALAGPHPVLLDEWQRVPDIWDAVKTGVDDHPIGGRYLLTGSAPTGATHSGAGPMPSLRMRPLSLPERGVAAPSVSLTTLLGGGRPWVAGSCPLGLGDYTDLIVASGFPGLQHLSVRAARAQLDGYLARIVEVDMEEAGHKVKRPVTLQAWMRAYAAATATTTSWAKIRDAASPGSDTRPARSTTIPYIEALTRLRVLDDIPAWIPSLSHLNRVGQAPKHHLVDPALAARLHGLGSADLLRGEGPERVPADGTFLGALFESLATMSVRVFASAARATVSHLRLQDGRHEVDLIVERDDHKYVGFEVKLSGTVDDRDTAHLRWLRQEDEPHMLDAVVLTTGMHAYRRARASPWSPSACSAPDGDSRPPQEPAAAAPRHTEARPSSLLDGQRSATNRVNGSHLVVAGAGPFTRCARSSQMLASAVRMQEGDPQAIRPLPRVVLMGARSNPPVELRPSTDRMEPPAGRKRVLKAEKAKIVELYQSGLSAIEVAEAVGVAKSTVLRVLESEGAQKRPHGQRYVRV